METKRSDIFSSWLFSHYRKHSEIIIWQQFLLSSSLERFSTAIFIPRRQILFGNAIRPQVIAQLKTGNISNPCLLLECKLLKRDTRGFTGSTANEFVTLRNLTSLSAEVKASSEAFSVIVFLIRSLPFWILSFNNKFSHRYFSCKYTFKKPNLCEGVWKKILHLSRAVCFHKDCGNLVFFETSIFLLNSTEIHQQWMKS